MVEDASLRIAFITQWYPPEPITVPKWIVTALHDVGTTIEVVTAQPNYPTGRIYNGFSGWRRSRRTLDGIEIVRVPTYASHDSSAIRRMLNYLIFGFSSSIFGLGAIRRADMALVYFSPPTAAMAALFGRLIYRKPFILYLQDLWPESLTATGMLPESLANNGAMRSLMNGGLHLLYRYAYSIAVISPGMKTRLIERGVPESKISVIANWADEKIYKAEVSSGEIRARYMVPHDALVLGYFGNHGKAQALDCWIRAVAAIDPIDRPWIFLIGDGTEKARLIELAQGLHLSTVVFLDSIPASEVPKYAAECNAQIVSLSNDPLFEITIPGKVQACLSLGQTILATLKGDAAQLVQTAQCGLTASPEDSEDVVRLISEYRSLPDADRLAMGLRGREYYLEHMSSKSGALKFKSLFRNARGKLNR